MFGLLNEVLYIVMEFGLPSQADRSDPYLEVAYTPIVNLADNRAPISVFYLQIRYLEESALSAYRPITIYRPDRDLSGQIEVYRADRPLSVSLLG